MPTTPKPPVFDVPKRVNDGTFIGGFGVSLKMIPTESTELLHPKSGGDNPSEANAGMSQFYSFHNNYADEYQSNTNENNVAHSTFLNDLGQSDNHDGRYEEERTSSNNMISFYSGAGVSDGFRWVRSPSRGIRRHHPSSTRAISASSVNNLVADSGGGDFVMDLLCGIERDSLLSASTRMPSSKNGGVVRSAYGETGRDRGRRQRSSQRRAAAAAKRKQSRLRKQRRRRRIPYHLRLAHQRAAAITERYVLREQFKSVSSSFSRNILTIAEHAFH
jgi:hypothetical protein